MRTGFWCKLSLVLLVTAIVGSWTLYGVGGPSRPLPARAQTTFTVSGTIDFEDWQSPLTKPKATEYEVELLFDGETSSGYKYTTNSNGYYEITRPSLPATGYFLRLYTKWSTQVGNNTDWVYVKVMENNVEKDQYVESPVQTSYAPGANQYSWTIPRTNTRLPALWVAEGLKAAKKKTLDYAAGPDKVRSIEAFWPNGRTDSYYKYLPGLDTWLPGKAHSIQLKTEALNDPVGFYDTVLHESGHWVMSKLYSTEPTGDFSEILPWTLFEYGVTGRDHATDKKTTSGIAWGEGWANFWSLYVQQKNPPSIFGWHMEDLTYSRNIDTSGANKPWKDPSGQGIYGEAVEGWVAAGLWDLYDAGQDAGDPLYQFDRYDGGFERIWNAMKNQPGGNSQTLKANQSSFREFWNQYTTDLSSGNSSLVGPARRAIYQNTISYEDVGIKSSFSLTPKIIEGNYAVVELRLEKTWYEDGLGGTVDVKLPDGVLRYSAQMPTVKDETLTKQSKIAMDLLQVRSDLPSTPVNSKFKDPSVWRDQDANYWYSEAKSSGNLAIPGSPVLLAQLHPFLDGSKDTPYNLQVNVTELRSWAVGDNAPASTAVQKAFRRGDAKEDGVVNIIDALFIAQFLAQLRDATAINPINAASPAHENLGASARSLPAAMATSRAAARPLETTSVIADRIAITDALVIAQMLAGIRDSEFRIPLTPYVNFEHTYLAIPYTATDQELAIKVGNLDNFNGGLGAFDIEVRYTQSGGQDVIRVTDVLAGDVPFDTQPTKNTNIPGLVTFSNKLNDAALHPKGPLTIARIKFNAVGGIGSYTDLTITVKTLVTNDDTPAYIRHTVGTARIAIQ